MQVLPQAMSLFILLLLLCNVQGSLGVKEDVKNVSMTDPCPHLPTSEMRPLLEFFDKVGHSMKCCGCPKDHFVFVPCSDGFFSECRACPSGTGLNETVHGHGIEACTQIIQPEEVFHDQENYDPETDDDRTQPPQIDQIDAKPPEKDKTNDENFMHTGYFLLAGALLISIAVAIFLIKRSGQSRSKQKDDTDTNSSANQTIGSRDDEVSVEFESDGQNSELYFDDETTPALRARSPREDVTEGVGFEADALNFTEAALDMSETEAHEATKETKDVKNDGKDATVLSTTHGEPENPKDKATPDWDPSAVISEPPVRPSVSNSDDLAEDGPTVERQVPQPIEQRGEHGGSANTGPPIQRGSAQPQMAQNTNQNTRAREIERLRQAENHVLHSEATSVFQPDVVRLLSHYQVPENVRERLANEYRNENDPLMYLDKALKEIRKNSDDFTVEVLIAYWRENGMRELATYLAGKMRINII